VWILPALVHESVDDAVADFGDHFVVLHAVLLGHVVLLVLLLGVELGGLPGLLDVLHA